MNELIKRILSESNTSENKNLKVSASLIVALFKVGSLASVVLTAIDPMEETHGRHEEDGNQRNGVPQQMAFCNKTQLLHQSNVNLKKRNPAVQTSAAIAQLLATKIKSMNFSPSDGGFVSIVHIHANEGVK